MHIGHGGDHFILADRHTQADALVLVHRQQMIDDVKALGPLGMVDTGDVHEGREPAATVGLEKLDKGPDVRRDHVDGQLAKGEVPADHAFVALCLEIGAQFLQRIAHRTSVPVLRIFFCSAMMPYSSASAVGGQPGT